MPPALGLMGSTREENMKVDMIVDCQEDCIQKLSEMYYREDAERKVTK